MKRLFFDIETSACIGMFWRPSWKTRISYNQIIHHAKIICISYVFNDDKEVKNIRWDKGDDRATLEEFVKIAETADEIVGHNGDRFDMKWLRTRCIQLGISFDPYIRTLDTLKVSKHSFNFPSNRLNDIGDFLGVGCKIKTEYEMWRTLTIAATWTQNFDMFYEQTLQDMCDYCDEDVELLRRVFNKLAPASKHMTHAGVIDGGHRTDCPLCGSVHTRHHERIVTAAGTVKHRMQCKSCHKHFTASNKAYMEKLVGEDFGSKS